MPRGGARPGAGRPAGQGRYGEPTKAVKIPISMVEEVKAFAESKTTSIPLYDFPVEAGSSLLVDNDDCKMFPLSGFTVQNPKDCFLAKVSGYSMKDAGILPGDLLLVDRKKEASHNDIVVSSIEGGVVVKRLDTKNARLISENKDFSPINITEHSNLHIWGVVKRVIREV